VSMVMDDMVRIVPNEVFEATRVSTPLTKSTGGGVRRTLVRRRRTARNRDEMVAGARPRGSPRGGARAGVAKR